ncbi:hypothetical protein EDD29_0391 [Actinocorallia herbida]|uniref:PH (Pleckstrin Homology) domain-containing protein n=1 Tax=Actinocorallia herbida TaxID=58109 RepID=A0A3N1CNK5_9ACTN|nr:hypothetical protein [Actinocorallia herbida]ROO82906.1 hypothetical protein EDD29_0391 [Actinocorallia herbida]
MSDARTYRLPAREIRNSAAIGGLVWLAVSAAIWGPGFLALPFAVSAQTVVTILTAAMVAEAVLTRTTADETGLTVRKLTSWRLPWEDVQGIKAMRHPNAVTGKSGPRRMVVYWDAQGEPRRIAGLDDLSVPGFKDEVARLQGLWTAHRGGSWREIPQVQHSIADYGRGSA